MNTEDRRNVIQLNRHLDTQGMTNEEEIAFNDAVNEKLVGLVEDELLNAKSDLLLEAITSCPDAWNAFITSVPDDDRGYSIESCQNTMQHLYKQTQNLIKELEAYMEPKLRSEAEELAL